METAQRASLRDYLAAQRTFLAWIRTGLALMGFGFVVARFGLFLQEFQTVERTIPAQSYGLSLVFGTALIAAGVIVNAFAGWRYAVLVRGLDRGETEHPRPFAHAVAIAFFLALVGLAMAAYLLFIGATNGSQVAKRREIYKSTAGNAGVIDLQRHHPVEGR